MGKIELDAGNLHFRYHCASFARWYEIDEALLHQQNLYEPHRKLLHDLRLVNSRCLLTDAVIKVLVEVQAAYLRAPSPLHMEPLSLSAMSRRLKTQRKLPMVPDTGRISRLVRGLSILGVDGTAIPLPTLFPSKRQIHRRRLEALIRTEKVLILNEQLSRPWPDDMLAELMSENPAYPITARSVGHIRHQLGIPCFRSRNSCSDYLMAAEGFSPLFPLTRSNLHTLVPSSPGVYEIRAKVGIDTVPMRDKAPGRDVSKVIYIGSSGDLKTRILDHLRGCSDNPQLFNLLKTGGTLARFRTVESEWRLIERQLYRAFCASFGYPPPCNRISP